MKDASSKTILGDVLKALEARVRDAVNEEPVVRAYIAWLSSDQNVSCTALSLLAEDARCKEGAGFTYRDVAVLGFTSSMLPIEAECNTWFRKAIHWMQGRRFFPPNRALGFEIDGLSILGVAAGISHLESGSEKEAAQLWLMNIIGQSLLQTPGMDWDKSLRKAASLLLTPPNTICQPDIEVEADLLTALAAKGTFRIAGEVEHQARLLILNLAFRIESTDRAATQLCALRWLLRQAATAIPTQATAEDLVAILKAIPRGLRRWTWEDKPRTKRAGAAAIKWDVQNEYHVQNLLWTILAPIFPDLEDEEYLRSLGHKHPRCDLAIPSLRLIIEVKFVLNGEQADFAKAIEGVAADTSLYLSEEMGFSQIVAFVWDNSRSSEQHAELMQGLKRIRGILDAVIVSRPGGWSSP